MDAKANLPSRHTTEGPTRAPHRSCLYAMGQSANETHQPTVGGESRWNEAASYGQEKGDKVAPKTVGRFDGATCGSRFGHTGLEAAVGGAIELPRDGDIIAIEGRQNVRLPDEALGTGAKAWRPREMRNQSGAPWKYARSVGLARFWTTTHSDGAKEKHCHADI